MKEINLIDTHVHLDAKDYNEDRDAVIARAKEMGVNKLICIGASDDLHSAKRACELAKKWDNIWASIGLHPHDAFDNFNLDLLNEYSETYNKIVAVGETGLDFFKEWAPRKAQEHCFRKQIEFAKKIKKPLIIHSRNAGDECLSILREMDAEQVGGVFHCYAEDAEYAKKLREINFMVSFPGIISFKNATNIQDAARDIPIEQIMLETDGPYLAPVPYRGKRCEPAYVYETAVHLARVKELTLEKVAEITTKNAEEFFNLNSV